MKIDKGIRVLVRAITGTRGRGRGSLWKSFPRCSLPGALSEAHGRTLGNLWKSIPKVKAKLAKTFTLTSGRRTEVQGMFGNISNSIWLMGDVRVRRRSILLLSLGVIHKLCNALQGWVR